MNRPRYKSSGAFDLDFT